VTAPAAAPTPTNLPLSTDAAVTTAPVPVAPVPVAPVPAAAVEPRPTPSPVQRGAMVDVDDPNLTRPVLVAQTRPRYPPLALARRTPGTVWLRALVDETGAVVEVSVVRASPRGQGFEDAATTYLRNRIYRPATKQGVPVRVWLPIVVEFGKADR
jgi:protein TonB